MKKKLLLLLFINFIFIFSTTAQNCPSYSSTVLSGNTACDNQTYYFEVENTNCPGTISFDVNADYGGLFGNEISWDITSNLTSNIIASSTGSSFGVFFGTIGPLDVNTEGQIYTFNVYDSWGDGLNVGGFVDIVQNGATLVSVTGNFGSSSTSVFGPTIDISSATLTITTPSGNFIETVEGCKDFSTSVTLANTNFCNTVLVSLPWEIRCDVTNAVLSSGTKDITVYPKVPTSSTDLIDINWNASTCSWDVLPQNDCDNLDIDNIFTILPSPSSLAIQACQNTNQNFTIDYLGMPIGPSCCSTGGALTPISYNANNTYIDFVVLSSPFGGTNNSAYSSIPSNNVGGAALSVTINVTMTGYSLPNSISIDDYWITVYVDGNPIYDVMHPASSPNFNQSFTLADIPNGYDDNSIVEVYVYPNSFSGNIPIIYTTYIPNGTSLGLGEWTASNFTVSLSANFTEMIPGPTNCSFTISEATTCCTPTIISDVSTNICSGGTNTLNTWINDVNTANTSCLIYSSVPPIAGTTLPNNVLPNGTNTTCSTINQIVSAYAYCDVDNNGNINSGDTYTLLSTFDLAVYPSAPTLSVDNGSCGIAPTANLICNSTNLNTRTGIAPLALPCGNGVNTTNLSGTFTANDIALLLNAPASCYSDISYNVTASCNQNPIANSIDNQTYCNSYTWIDGNTYTSSNNTATHTIVGGSSLGCDSIVTLDLTINLTANGTDSQTACNSFNWINGNTYTASNTTATHTIVGGSFLSCDSIVTLDLIINTFISSTDSHTACNTFDWIDGNTYNSSDNTATHTIVGGSSVGCDSIVTLDLTISTPSAETVDLTSCNPADEGVVIQQLTNQNGCDSILTINTSLINSEFVFDFLNLPIEFCCTGTDLSIEIPLYVTGSTISEIYVDNLLLTGNTLAVNSLDFNSPELTYTIRVVSQNGCSSSETITLYRNCINPSITVVDTIFAGEFEVFQMTTENTFDSMTCVWSTTDVSIGAISNNTIQDATFNGIYEDTYDASAVVTAIFVQNNDSVLYCHEDAESKLYEVVDFLDLKYPNAFTPNGDNLNNIFKPIMSEHAQILDFRVYNRWGEIVYDISKATNKEGWDGTCNGEEQPSEVYMYFISVRNFKEVITREGCLNLIR